MDILIKPILTERMAAQGEKLNRYGFIVDPRANKLQIKDAVEAMYNVVVMDVNTLNYMASSKAATPSTDFWSDAPTISRRRSSP